VTTSNTATVNEVNLEKLLKDIQLLEGIVATWEEKERNTVDALKRAIDALNKEALSRLIQRLKNDSHTMSLLKEALSDEIVYSVLRHHQLIKASLNERVEAALESVRPALKGHGGNVELVAIEAPNRAVIRLIGACSGCPASELTLTEGVEKAIKEACPEITEIVKSKGVCTSDAPVSFVSPFARGKDRDWIFACQLDEVPEQNFRVCEVGGQTVLLARFGEKVVCYQNACAHLGMPLDMGEVNNGILKCPYHGFEYILETGECVTAQEIQLHTHAVRVDGKRVEVSLT
jgi:nitrite reductase/ring-hydroxylating ferredoxin subunit/Fe-S cluster biogenesis protein NfuA